MIDEKVRIDKWLYAVRICKTRSLAAELCEREKISINDHPAKASKLIKPHDVITIHKGPFRLQYKVLKITDKRMGAKLVSDFYEDVTSREETERVKVHAANVREWRVPGAGRPTKKERRSLDEFTSFDDF